MKWEAVEVGVNEWFVGVPGEGGGYHFFTDCDLINQESADAFAATLTEATQQAIALEREACAKVADSFADNKYVLLDRFESYCSDIAAAIRARTNA